MNTVSQIETKIGTLRQIPINKMMLRFYTKLLVLFTFLLVIAGGLVTSTKSGLAVPDWPLSYGQVMPPMVGGIRYEHSHRLVASLVGFMTLILTFWIGCSEKRAWLRRAGIVAFFMVVMQGILGGLTVLYLLPAPISIAHACLAQTFFVFTVCLAYFVSKEWTNPKPLKLEESKVSILKNFLIIAVALIYLQLILGASFRHTGNRYLLIPHIIGAFLVLIQLVGTLVAVLKNLEGEKRFTQPAVFSGILVLFQLFLGLGAFIFVVSLKSIDIEMPFWHVFFITAHQTIGALLLASITFLTVRFFRLIQISRTV